MDYWNGRTTGLDYWNGLLECKDHGIGMDCWNGLLDL